MKQKIIVCLLVLLILAACGAQASPEPELSCAGALPMLKEAPVLTVSAGDASLEVRYGTSSWTYDNGDGTSTGHEACGIHPLDGEPYLDDLGVINAVALLDFGPVPPDEIWVQCWSTDFWGSYEAPSTELPVENSTFQLLDGSFVYEVFAKWSNREGFEGNAYYAFTALAPTNPDPATEPEASHSSAAE